MNWDERNLSILPIKQGFRMRGMDMTRLEAFTDAAFAFAITLLVISGSSIPESYQDLFTALKEIPAFAASFASIALIWISHHQWSRRYGLEDMGSIIISLSLIFIMLVYVYPLRMMFSVFFAFASGGLLPTSFAYPTLDELVNLFIIYGLGFFFIMLMITLLYFRAMKIKDKLCLNSLEQLRTREDIVLSIILAVTGLASAIFAWIMPIKIGVFAGFVYMTLMFSMPYSAIRFDKKAQRLRDDK